MLEIQKIIYNIFGFDKLNPISLISGYFLFALTLFLILYSVVYRWIELRKWTLIVFNLFFYFKLTGMLSFIILVPAIVDYFSAKKIQQISSEGKKRLLLSFSIITSLGLLIYFKYSNFFLEIINQFSGTSFTLLKIIIPVGISFYVFRTISYVVDVYNEKVECVQKFSDYMVYMTFFPLMISGPITRAEQFIPQINQKEGVSREKINSGIYYIIKGIVKKAIFADYLSVYVAMIFAAPKGYSGIENLVGIVCFTIQLYLDFSGYTDIATGISKIIGFEIGTNFNEPFKAKSVSEFWRRWHISLSDWLKDYIFSPLNFYFRKMKVFGAILAMFITFFICGIWHGTTWVFILFGIIHGIVLSWELATRNFFSFKAKGFLTFVMSPILWILTFSFLVVSMMAMKVESVETAWGFISKLWTDTGFQNARLFFEVQLAFTSMFLIAILLVFSPTKLKNKFQLMFIKSHVSVKICIMLLLVQIMIELQNQNIVPFIYAQY